MARKLNKHEKATLAEMLQRTSLETIIRALSEVVLYAQSCRANTQAHYLQGLAGKWPYCAEDGIETPIATNEGPAL